MQHPTRKPVGPAYYAAAVDADRMPVLALALVSAVLSAVGFLVAAGLAGVIRFSSDPEVVEEAVELPEYLSEPAGADDPASEPPTWREQFEGKKAKLEEEIQRLNREIELTRARAENDRQHLEGSSMTSTDAGQEIRNRASAEKKEYHESALDRDRLRPRLDR